MERFFMSRFRARLVASALTAVGVFALSLGATPEAHAQQTKTAQKAAQKADTEKVDDRAALILAADIDGVIAKTRVAQAQTATISGAIVVGVDQLAHADYPGAAATIAALPPRERAVTADLLEMWSLLLQGKKDEANARAALAEGKLSSGIGPLAVPLVMESGGDLKGAAASYAKLVASFDTSPLPSGEPKTAAEARRLLEAARMAQTIYRAALVSHRLGEREDATKYYLLADQFAPDSADIADNLDRLAKGQPPREPALTPKSGLGRWVLFVGYQFAFDYTLRRAQTTARGQNVSATTLDALVGPMFSELGLSLDPSANDWRLGAANELMGAGGGGYVGADKLLRAIPADSPFAPDVKIAFARLALLKKDDAAAAAAARQAIAAGPARWDIKIEAGRALSASGHDEEALSALSAAVTSAVRPDQKSEALLSRAGVNFQAGRLADSGADARAAVAANGNDTVRLSAAGYLSTAPDGWFESIRMGREVLFARPRSVDAMNTLGYALIQREQGLDEGFKLLSEGVEQEPDFYPIVDSLGWAYYSYGDFETARRLISKANDLSKDEPNSEVLDHLGDIYWRLDRKADAKKSWRLALTYKPDATRRAELTKKVAVGLTTPAPAKRTPPRLDSNPYKMRPENGPI
jgi:tetratricopeptide (TPR) repeat protein